MRRSNPTGWLIGAVFLGACCIAQVVFAATSSGDMVRLALATVAAIAAAVATFGFYITWRKESRRQR